MNYGYLYPPENISIREKEMDEYGLAYAKAMYYASNRFGARFFYDDVEFSSLQEVAQGRQSVDNIRKLFGHFRSASNDAANDGGDSLAYIDIQVLNLAPKYINRAVAKMQRLNYDIGLTAVDAKSVDMSADYQAKIQALYEMREWMKDIGQNPQVLFPDININLLPKYPDELLFRATVNPKIQRVIDGEKSLTLLHYINDYRTTLRQTDWDSVVFGRSHTWCYLDNNGVPREKRLNPKYVIGSYVDNEDYKDQENVGFFDFITVNQFIKEVKGKMSNERIDEICRKYAFSNSIIQTVSVNRDWNKYDGLDYLPVMRFYFRSQDDRKYIIRKNKFGNDILLERPVNWNPGEEVSDRFKPDGDSRIVENSYTSVYGGTWIIDSDIAYNYERQDLPRTNLVNATLPIITVAPNMREGRVVSFAAQMIEPLYMINVAWNKIKQILARGWMGIREINFDALENVSISRGGKQWKPIDVYEHLLKTDILVARGQRTQFDQKFSDAVNTNPSGLQLSDYFETFTMAINILEQLTGTSVAEAADQPDRLAVGVMKASQFASDLDMEYLYNSHEVMYKRVSDYQLRLLQQAKKNGTKISGFYPALGASNMFVGGNRLESFEVPDEIAYSDYGLMLVPQPTAEEWIGFLGDVTISLKEGKITAADSAFIRQMNNLKDAREMLAIREDINKRELAQEAQRNNDMMMQANAESAAQKLESELAKVREKGRIDQELVILQARVAEAAENQKFQHAQILAGIQQQVDKEIATQDTTAEIMKQAVRNIPEKMKVGQKETETAIYSQIDREALDVQREAAKKDKAATKKK
jgi:hypothetical protein